MTPEEKLGAIRDKLDELNDEVGMPTQKWQGMQRVIQSLYDILDQSEEMLPEEEKEAQEWYLSIMKTEPRWHRVQSTDPGNKRITGFKGTHAEAKRISTIAETLDLGIIVWDPDGFPVVPGQEERTHEL